MKTDSSCRIHHSLFKTSDLSKIRRYPETYKLLENFSPDVIFVMD